MRPKKRILLIDSNDDRRRELTYFLRVHGYEPVMLADERTDLVIVHWPAKLQLVCEIAYQLHCPLLAIGDREEIGAAGARELFRAVLKPAKDRAELRAFIHAMSARKRGPRRATPLVAKEWTAEEMKQWQTR